MVGVQEWAEIRRLVLVEGWSQREVARRLGLARDTVARAVGSEVPPKYCAGAGTVEARSVQDWVCEQLRWMLRSRRSGCVSSRPSWAMRAASRSSMTMCARSVLGSCDGGRSSARSIGAGELVQCDLWEPREPVPVGHGQTRRGWVVTVELCWSRVIAGALVFSKEAPDILWGLSRNL